MMFVFLPISTALAALLVLSVSGHPTIFDQIFVLESSNSSLLRYPTQLTQGIIPKAMHSHNDYWRDVPLLTAISHGASSVEADVWLINGTLYVGHELGALSRSRTFSSLYIEPLLRILQMQNPETEFTAGSQEIHGVFDSDSGVPLQLLVDIKTDGVEAFPFIVEALEPLRSPGYLTTFVDGSVKHSAVTVVGTGGTPLSSVQNLTPRDVFYDAPLASLDDGSQTWDATISPLASTDYAAVIGWSGLHDISDAQRDNITKLVTSAHARGIAARFWDTPAWPVFARDNCWRELLRNGVDFLNVDDVEAASKF